MRQKIEYIGATLLIGFFRILPYHWSVQLGGYLGRMFCWCDRRHRRIALENLKSAFQGEKTDAEMKRIVSGVYQNLGKGLIEGVLLPGMAPSGVKAMTEIEGLEHYFSARDRRKGIILLSAHFGNWEWLGTALPIYGAKMHVVMRPLDNNYLDRMIQGWRMQRGNIVLNKKTETGEIIKLLRSGATIGFLLDQNVGREKAVFVDYFGKPAATNKALATIALRTGAPVLPTFIIRKEGGHKVVFEKPLTLPRTGNLKNDLVEITALFTKKIESYVRRFPDQWLWLHRRWRTQPPDR